MADQNSNQLDRVLAFLSPECLDQLCDLIIAKLEGRNPWVLTSLRCCYTIYKGA